MPLIEQLFVHPIKSCRPIEVARVPLGPQGLAHDRQWMVVDARGRFLTQRELPAMARLVVDLPQAVPAAPGDAGLDDLPSLEGLPAVADLRRRWAEAQGRAGADAPQCRVQPGHDQGRLPIQVWNYEGQGIDCGDEAAAFLSRWLDRPVRLVRFPEDQQRSCNPRWTGTLQGSTRFFDGYPVLVLGSDSVRDLAARMGQPHLAMERFRPNVVLADLPAYEEDHIVTLCLPRQGQAQPLLQLVKPCPRCSMPDLDPHTGEALGQQPTAQLARYRYHTAAEGAVLGMNALPLTHDAVLHKGQRLEPIYGF